MAEPTTPREMIRAMLRGEPPPRPLLLPIVFSLGARLENLSQRTFQSNPTKIANALRQLRTVLGLDGVSCYFDPYLEAEALGCELEWSTDESSCVFRQVEGNVAGPRGQLPSPDEIVGRGRIPVACDVLRRLKMMLSGEPALTAGVTGPSALAAQLRGSAQREEPAAGEMLEYAAGVTAAVCRSFLDAGANVVFLREESALIGESHQWAALLAPIVNVIRFYEALPVLVFRGQPHEGAIAALSAGCEGVICPGVMDIGSGRISTPESAWPAVCLPAACFLPTQDGDGMRECLRSLDQEAGLCLLTSDGDVPARADVKYLATLLGKLRSLSRRAA